MNDHIILKFNNNNNNKIYYSNTRDSLVSFGRCTINVPI